MTISPPGPHAVPTPDATAHGLPRPCGPISEAVVRALTAPPGRRRVPQPSDVRAVGDPLTDRDFQLGLWMLYEMHFRGFDDVDPFLEWDPLLLAARRSLEMVFERALRELAEPDDDLPTSADEVTTALLRVTTDATEPALAAYLAREATEDQFRAYLAQRAVFHLREADVECLLLARLSGAPKAALAEIQYDELGAGRADRLHADLFARALESLDMPTDITTYVDGADATTLATVNAGTMLNLHRRLRGAAAGHFAAFEATSSVPCKLIAAGADRLGLPPEVATYYTEHVEADSVHEQVAINALCGELVAADPTLGPDVLLGASICLAVHTVASDVMLAAWREGSAPEEEIAS
ncbi:iron-containing redox enzyme family protein [Nocardioides sp. MH1]|uniref:iron-containing redox enzyme family protein n=1 Tax=Nocardioides sp. MH1 TaxID=3242490 RepID=UPI003522DA5D